MKGYALILKDYPNFRPAADEREYPNLFSLFELYLSHMNFNLSTIWTWRKNEKGKRRKEGEEEKEMRKRKRRAMPEE